MTDPFMQKKIWAALQHLPVSQSTTVKSTYLDYLHTYVHFTLTVVLWLTGRRCSAAQNFFCMKGSVMEWDE